MINVDKEFLNSIGVNDDTSIDIIDHLNWIIKFIKITNHTQIDKIKELKITEGGMEMKMVLWNTDIKQFEDRTFHYQVSDKFEISEMNVSWI